MEKSQKLIYNEHEGKLTQDEIFKLSEDEFYDYILSQNDESVSDEEIILNYEKGTEELIQEIRKFHDNMAALVINNKISLRNKFNFIMDLLKVENKEEVFPLLVCFICDVDYIFNLKKIIVKEKSKRNLARYLRLKEKMRDFLEKFKFIKEQEKDYENFIKQVLKKDKADESKGEELSNEKREILKKLFMEYVENNIDEIQFFANLEHIHKFSTSTEERKAIYPNLIFKLFTKYKSKIAKKTFIITNKSILNYMGYKIEKDNYKNFPTNKQYIKLFFELCNEFCEDKDLKLNLFVFEKCSNLGKWYWLQDDKNTDFCYSYESLFETSYSKRNSIFPDESRYYENEQYCRGIKWVEEKNGNKVEKEITEDEYIDSFIEEHLEEVMTEPREYLNEYIKGKNKAELYVEKSAQEIMRYVDEDFQKDFYFIRHFYWCVEYAFREISDFEVKRDIVEFIREVEI